ncbi:hypothetical protein BSU04_21800 [Caballeronia sordidicola]|uniref:Mobile element protein n=1 Tax=Caballeronia sordidicola TaxID=196367 RepID=A0A226X0B3_CABSO|nr:hypothetical protein BSU04_21800 [Caballeronia sordidicola]
MSYTSSIRSPTRMLMRMLRRDGVAVGHKHVGTLREKWNRSAAPHAELQSQTLLLTKLALLDT